MATKLIASLHFEIDIKHRPTVEEQKLLFRSTEAEDFAAAVRTTVDDCLQVQFPKDLRSLVQAYTCIVLPVRRLQKINSERLYFMCTSCYTGFNTFRPSFGALGDTVGDTYVGHCRPCFTDSQKPQQCGLCRAAYGGKHESGFCQLCQLRAHCRSFPACRRLHVTPLGVGTPAKLCLTCARVWWKRQQTWRWRRCVFSSAQDLRKRRDASVAAVEVQASLKRKRDQQLQSDDETRVRLFLEEMNSKRPSA